MGRGAWDDDTYKAAATFRAATKTPDFAYSATTKSKPAAAWKAADSLNPYGVKVRECRDSADHPNTTPIAVFFDVTGSMGYVPQVMQKRLGELHGLLQRKGYVEDPEILFGAIGDADTDRVPLQVGQFESDIRMDEQLREIFLEANGGGQKSETYELAAYFMANHTATDAWEKRGKKGYLFIIGDEMNKRVVKSIHLQNVLGEEVTEDVSVAEVYRQLQERWEVFFILPRQTSYFDDPQVNQHWRDLLGERLLKLEDPDGVCDLIALTVGLLEDTIDLDEGLADLKSIGSNHGAAVSKALAPLGAGRTSGAVATSTLPKGLAGTDDLA
jgi:hypothetical protein